MKLVKRYSVDSLIMILLFGYLWDPGPGNSDLISKSSNNLMDSILQRNNLYDSIASNHVSNNGHYQTYPFTPYMPPFNRPTDQQQFNSHDYNGEYVPQSVQQIGDRRGEDSSYMDAEARDAQRRRLDSALAELESVDAGVINENIDGSDMLPPDCYEIDIDAYNELVQSQQQYDESRRELWGEVAEDTSGKSDTYFGMASGLQHALNSIPNLGDESTKLMMEMDHFDWSKIFAPDQNAVVQKPISDNCTDTELLNEFFYPPEFDEDYSIELPSTQANVQQPVMPPSFPITPNLPTVPPQSPQSSTKSVVNVQALSNDHEYERRNVATERVENFTHPTPCLQSNAIAASSVDCNCLGACSCSHNNVLHSHTPSENTTGISRDELPSLDLSGYPVSTDAVLLKQLGIPITITELQELTQDQFIAFQKQHSFTPSQIETIRAVRRRHKNKLAARNSRARRNIGTPRPLSVSKLSNSAQTSRRIPKNNTNDNVSLTPKESLTTSVEESSSSDSLGTTPRRQVREDGSNAAIISTNSPNPVVITSEKIAQILEKIGTKNPPKALNIYTDNNGTLVVIPSYS